MAQSMVRASGKSKTFSSRRFALARSRHHGQLAAHKREAITPPPPLRRSQAVLVAEVLPRSPIEQVFAKLKRLLRKAAARTTEIVSVAVGQLIGTFTPDECANYLRHAATGKLKSVTL
jgi:hypothetical protein